MAGGALEDFSRRPLQYKVLVFAGIAVLLGLLYWQFAYSPLQKEREAAAADLEEQKGEASRLKEQKRQYDDLVAKEAQLKADIEQNQKALPTESEIPAFLDMLSRKTNEAGIEMHKRDVRKDVIIDTGPVAATPGGPPRPPPPPGVPGAVAPASFVKVPVDIEVTGTYYQLKRFFSSLRPKLTEQVAGAPKAPEEKDRIVTIESLTLTDPKVKNNEIVLTARFVASTFRADKPAAAPGAPPPTPPPATAPATAPTPGAGTATGATGAGAGTAPAAAARPDTMKAKTEAAIDASEKRVQQSPGGGQ